MLTPSTKLLLENDTLELHQNLLAKMDDLYNKIDEGYLELDKLDNDYDKELMSVDEFSKLSSILQTKLDEYERQLEELDIEEYKLFDNLETLL